MSEGRLLWHSRHCGRVTTGVPYKGPLTPSTKRAARLIRRAGPYFRSAQCPTYYKTVGVSRVARSLAFC